MKFNISNLEEEQIACLKKIKATNMKQCFKCIYLNDCFNQNIEQIKNKIKIQCENNNENKFCQKEKCEDCNEHYFRNPAGFICPNCNTILSLSKSQLKRILKKDYEEIDIDELNIEIDKLITKFNLINLISQSDKETINYINKTNQNNNIIKFKNNKKEIK